jgi:hypothetical protein
MDTVIKIWVALITSKNSARFEKFEITQQDIDGYYLGETPVNIDSAISYYKEKYCNEVEQRLETVTLLTEEEFDELCLNILSPDCQD